LAFVTNQTNTELHSQ